MTDSGRAWLAGVALMFGCQGEATPQPELVAKVEPASNCPVASIAEARAPDVTPELESAEFWLAKLEPGEADRVLIGEPEREAIQARIAATPGAWRDPSDPAWAVPEHVDRELSERLEFLRGRVGTAKYVEGEPEALEQAALTIAGAAAIAESDAMRHVLAETPLWCVPTLAGLYTTPIDREFDRNQCSSLHFGELVRLVRAAGDWVYVEAGHSVGWVHAGVFGPPSSGPKTAFLLDDWAIPNHPPLLLRAGTRFGSGDAGLRLPTAAEEETVPIPPDAPISIGPLELTRRHVFEQAFAQLGDPYGWGGRDGRRDCSSLVFDVFAQFDLKLGRNSAVQSQLGTRAVELAGQPDADKRTAIRESANHGVVLLYMPGHIMVYLGHHSVDGVEHDYGISAISDFLVPCPGGPDTIHKLDRVAVSTLELGRGSERRAYIERIERLAVFGLIE